MKAKAKPRRVPTLKPVKRTAARARALTESDRNVELHAQVARLEERITNLQDHLGRLANERYIAAQESHRFRNQVERLAPQLKRVLDEKDALLRNQQKLMGERTALLAGYREVLQQAEDARREALRLQLSLDAERAAV